MHPHQFVVEMKKQLGRVSTWLDKAVAHSTAKKFDLDTLVHARLAPDMFPLSKQIQSVCDQAKFAASRVAGKEPPAHPDNEQTIDELRKRVATVIAYLDGFKKEDFAGYETRMIKLPFFEGKAMTATDYFIELVQPNFYFHLMTVYAILRHNGVEIGKRDYIGSLSFS